MDEPKGAAFPLMIDPVTGGVRWAGGTDKVRQDVVIALNTRRGERPMRRDYGTAIHALVHEPNSGALAQLIAREAQESLLGMERRVLVSSVDVRRREEGLLELHLNYVHTDRPQAGVLVVPLG